ncbi:sensor histidine kinase [Roseobacteraceae bacterium NS-SX3]
MTIALLPLGLIALYQTNAVVEEASRLTQSAVLARTESTASQERERLQRAGGAAGGLAATILPATDEPEVCSAIMRAFVRGQDLVSFAAFIGADGTMQCTSDGSSGNVAGSWPYLKAVQEGRLSFAVGTYGQGSEGSDDDETDSQLLATSPVWQSGDIRGYVSIAIPHSLAARLQEEELGTGGIQFVTVDTKGDILSASMPLEDAGQSLPVSVPRRDLIRRTGDSFFENARSGEERFYAVSGIIPGQVAVVGSWPFENALTAAGNPAAVTLAFPVLMWLAGIAVAVFGLQRMVIRHLSALRRAMRRYALGERENPRLKLESPPKEFEEAEQSFNRMVAILSEAERRREQDLQEKTVLLREVHHRVKNNLQLIASIMNMLGRGARTPEARRMLVQLQRRVRGLATIHRTLNTNPDVTTIGSRDLINELINEIGAMNMSGGQEVVIEKDLDQVPLSQDQAVSLSMLVSEAMTNAVKYVGVPEGKRPEITVNFHEGEDNELALEVTNTKGEPVLEPELAMPGSGIGEQLMRAFAIQLQGDATTEDTEDSYSYRLTFPAEELETAAKAAHSQAGQGKNEPATAS